MPDNDDLPASPFAPLLSDVSRMRRSGLRHAIEDVDKVINLLVEAREKVAQGTSSGSYCTLEDEPLTMTLDRWGLAQDRHAYDGITEPYQGSL